jgi:hypothetical protein
MSTKGPWASIAALAVVAVVALGAGTVFGVGPLAATPPPREVTDPKEMLARSLQATIDATAVHLDGSASGRIPGQLVERPEASVSLDGTVLAGDIRPKDAKTRAHIASPGLAIAFDTVTVWDGVWYRTAADGPWTKASLGRASADAGVDINPLTLVDRLRSYLATPGLTATTRDVACSSASGRCHEVRLEAGSDPATILALFLPHERARLLPPVDTVITLQTDVETLRPAHLVVDAVSADGSVVIHLVLDASRWDGDVVIEEPSASPG